MLNKFVTLLEGVNEAKVKASDANSLFRFEITAALLFVDVSTIIAQEHHDIMKNSARFMTDTKLFRREAVAYDAVISRQAAELQKKIMVVRALMD